MYIGGMEIVSIPRVTKEDAIRIFGEGKQTALATTLGVSPQAVQKWGEYIPTEQAKKLYRLRPELFLRS